MRLRFALGLVGVSAGLFGAYSLLGLGWTNVVDATWWLVGGVLAHDAILAPLAIAVVALGLRVTPDRLRAPLAAGLVVLATVTLTAVPVLGRFGARPDNPTLLDRNYTAGWIVLLGLVSLSVMVMTMLNRNAASRR